MEVLREKLFLNLVCCLILLLLIFYLKSRYNLQYWSRRGVPQLKKSNKVFGDFKNAILFRTAPGYHLGEIYRKTPPNAPYVGFYIFHKPCLLLKDPEIIKQLLVRDFDNFANRHFAGTSQKDSIGMINLFGLKDPAWRYLKKKVTPTLTRNKLKQILPLMLDTSQTMMNYLKTNVGDECKGIDAQDISYKYTADLIGNVALGTKTDSFNYPDSNYTKCPFQGDNLLFQAGTFFSGLESSSTVAAFTLMELAKHNKHQELAREEIRNSINKYGWSMEGFRVMKYLDMCVAEGVRLHPPISTLDRCTLNNYKIPDTELFIEKGTPIFVSLYGLHRDSRFFSDPDVFHPARYADCTFTSDAYLPFGVGPRNCVGEQLGRLHVKVMLSKILSEYKVYQAPTEVNKLDPRATFTAAADGIHIKFSKLTN